MPHLSDIRFVLSADPVTSAEQQALAHDVDEHGLDASYWDAMNGLLTTRSRSDTPLVLRGCRGDRLAGLAHIMECRRTNHCLFPGWLGRLLDTAPSPAYVWARGHAAVDLLGSPGFVAPGEDRQVFYREAVAWLNSRYRLGTVVEPRTSEPAAPHVEAPMMDWGVYQVEAGGVERLLGAHRHLHRKENRFRNKGGTLHVVAGALAPDDRAGVLACLRASAGHALVRAPFQENYANMVQWAAENSGPAIVHVIARIDGVMVGYHAFLRSGVRLQCLSGGFDRTRSSTYHAYENILLEAMRYAEREGLLAVAFGPVGNASKAAVMPAFEPFVFRFYARSPAVRRFLTFVIPRSAMGPSVIGPWTDLEAKRSKAPATDDAPVAAPV